MITLTDGTVLDPIKFPANPSSTEQESFRYQKIKGEEAYRVMGIGTVSDYDVVIPETYRGLPITEIGAHAFENEQYISSITISDNITTIGEYAFDGCSSLTSVEIPDSVTSIGDNAFNGCSSLTSVACPTIAISYIPKANLQTIVITSGDSIPSNAFYKCSSLTSVVIGNGVTSIGDSAFEDCSSLTSVVIGGSVTSIGMWAFCWCSSLTSVYYKGTASEWSAISINSTGNSSLTNATKYYYSETEPTSSGNYWHDVDGVPTKW